MPSAALLASWTASAKDLESSASMNAAKGSMRVREGARAGVYEYNFSSANLRALAHISAVTLVDLLVEVVL